MGKMSWISYLCESGNREELIEEVGSVEIADEFLRAHNQMRERKEEPAFKVLNKIHNNMKKEVHDGKVSSVRVQSKK